MSVDRQLVHRLHWQSQLPLFLAIMLGTAGIAVQCFALAKTSPSTIVLGFALGLFLALLTWRLRAATPAAALAGGLFSVALYLGTPGWRTALWPLLALMLLTHAATRFGRARKEKLGVAEGTHGRSARQVAANLGVTVLASVPLDLAHSLTLPRVLCSHVMQLALAAALSEAAADTLSSELGEVLGGEPRLITTFRRVPAGTDGAVSLAGSIAGITGAIVTGLVALFAFSFTASQIAIVTFAAVAGLFADSFLGAVFERRGWLNNDAVNFLSTLFAALVTVALGSH